MGLVCSDCVARNRVEEPGMRMGPVLSSNATKVTDNIDALGGSFAHKQASQSPNADYIDVGSRKQLAGSFGIVKFVKSRVTGALCALKTVKKDKASMGQLRREVEINLCLDHPSIVRLFDVYEDKEQVYMVFEACCGGEILQEILKHQHFCERDALCVLGQLLWAMNYLHAKNIAHRDLKLENLLLKESGVELLRNTIKLVDFGLATRFTPGTAEMLSVAGSSFYIAPEILLQSSSQEGYSEKCDIWSCGVLSYMLITGKPPCAGVTEKEILQAVISAKIEFADAEWGNASPQLQELVKQMLTRKPRARADINTALQLFHKIPVADDQTDDGFGVRSPCPQQNQTDVFFTNLKEFGNKCHFERAARYLVAFHSSGKNVEELRSVFKKFDANGDGMLSFSEAKQGFKSMDWDDEYVTELFANIDTDNSQQIEYTEFLAAALQKETITRAQVWEAFRAFDRNGDGVIDQDEMEIALSRHSTPEHGPKMVDFGEVLRSADKNGDGKIDFEEFHQLLKK